MAYTAFVCSVSGKN